MENNLRYYRSIFNINQRELAKEVGLSKNTISLIENGSGITLDHAINIAKFFKVPLRDIFPSVDLYEIDHAWTVDNYRRRCRVLYYIDHPEEYEDYKQAVRESLTPLVDDEEPPF